jgi:nucleoside-diphosphate-sugar epimerase
VFEPALTAPVSGVVNVAGPDAISIAELVTALGDAIGIAPRVRHRPSDVEGDLVGATERMRDTLGVIPRVGVRDGLRRVAQDLAVRSSMAS